MRFLLIDDQREFGKQIPMPKEGDEWEHALTFDEGILSLKLDGPFDLLYLDHDYGHTDPAKNGEGIMKFLEAFPELLPKRIEIVSQNPVGRQRMQVIVNRLYRHHRIFHFWLGDCVKAKLNMLSKGERVKLNRKRIKTLKLLDGRNLDLVTIEWALGEVMRLPISVRTLELRDRMSALLKLGK